MQFWTVDIGSIHDFNQSIFQLQYLLSQDRQKRLAKFCNPLHAASSLVGDLLPIWVLHSFYQTKIHDITLTRTETGKPFISSPNPCPFSFNISHDGNWVVIAISDNTSPIGVDIMRKQLPDGFDNVSQLHESLSPFLSEKEALLLHNMRDDILLQYLLCSWMHKEAISKAMGCGLSLDFATIDLDIAPLTKTDNKCEAKQVVVQSVSSMWRFAQCDLQEQEIILVGAQKVSQPGTYSVHNLALDDLIKDLGLQHIVKS